MVIWWCESKFCLHLANIYNIMISKYFKLSEFHSKDGADFPKEVLQNLQKLAVNLDVIREEIGLPIHVNSGYRSTQHNKKIGGAKNSYHVKGMASDLSVRAISPGELKEIIVGLMDSKKITAGGVKAYDTFVHYDIRGKKTLF